MASKVLVTGGSGFIAAHILQQLVKAGYSVVTTVRTDVKAAHIREAFPGVGADKLQIVLVPDINSPNAFDEAVQVPGIDVVLHTASPFHFRATDPIKDLVDPAVSGTTGILKALVKYAPHVKRVVVTSSFAAILDSSKVDDPTTVFTEASWNPVQIADIQGSAVVGYLASKKLAEKAAWDFVASEKPNFDLATINPPMVFGPIAHHIDGAAGINTSNERILDAIRGVWKAKGEVPDTGAARNWVDVRDVAKAHILAGLTKKEAGGHRLFTTEGQFGNRDIFDIIRKNFPEYADRLPANDVPGGYLPKTVYGYDNSETTKLLGIEWTKLEKTIVDTVNSLKVYAN